MKKPAGAHLRDTIASLLRIQYSDVKVETRVGATTADVLFVDDTQPLFKRSIAIESKDWKKPLTSAQIATIVNLYTPALNSREIDNLWIISRHPLASSPALTIKAIANVVHTTLDEFMSSLMDLLPIARHNISTFQQDESYSTYIDGRVKGKDITLMSAVDDWIKSPKTGLVIYGGYGMGKTTFSKYASSELSRRFMEDSTNRIPVRFSLGDIYHKQDLISLISSSLVGAEGGVRVKNFSYPTFIEMNRLGRLILIFDGFDEMRHAIEIDDFIFNFEQMKPLFDKRAKVIILGRPDAFLSADEESRVLSSMFNAKSQAKDNLELIEVDLFRKNEIEDYLSRYLRANKSVKHLSRLVAKTISMLPDEVDDNILARPVQLRMFTSVMDDVDAAKFDLTRYKLYEQFVYKFIIREHRKQARTLPPGTQPVQWERDERPRFMQNLAWWVLSVKKENRFLPSEIPMDLVPQGIRSGKTTDAAVREALVGSVVEAKVTGVVSQKANRYYYFPHKSYIEFLIAQYFSYAKFSIDMYREFVKNMTHEVVSFVEEGPAAGIDSLRTGVGHSSGYVAPFVMKATAKGPGVGEEIANSSTSKINADKIYTYYYFLVQTGGDVSGFLRRQISLVGAEGRCLALLNCVGAFLLDNDDNVLAQTVVIQCLSAAFDIHKARRFDQEALRAEVFRGDESGVKAGAVVHAMRFGDGMVRLFPDALSAYTVAVSRSTLWTRVAGEGRKTIELQADDILVAAGDSRVLFEHVLEGARRLGEFTSPVVLRGQAAERFTVDPKELSSQV